MNVNDLTKVIEETKRFLTKAIEAKKRLKEDPSLSIGGCRETASAKRASLDLSHVLADFRKPPWRNEK